MSKVKVGGYFFNWLKYVCGISEIYRNQRLLLCSFTYIERERVNFKSNEVLSTRLLCLFPDLINIIITAHLFYILVFILKMDIVDFQV